MNKSPLFENRQDDEPDRNYHAFVQSAEDELNRSINPSQISSFLRSNKAQNNINTRSEHFNSDRNLSPYSNNNRNVIHQTELPFMRDQDTGYNSNSHSNSGLRNFISSSTRFDQNQYSNHSSKNDQDQQLFMTSSTSRIRNNIQQNPTEQTPRFANSDYFATPQITSRDFSNNQEINTARNHKQPSLLTSTPILKSLPSNRSDFFKASEMTPIVSRHSTVQSNKNNFSEPSPIVRTSHTNQTPRRFDLCKFNYLFILSF
jgi:hypothetical protein